VNYLVIFPVTIRLTKGLDGEFVMRVIIYILSPKWPVVLIEIEILPVEFGEILDGNLVFIPGSLISIL